MGRLWYQNCHIRCVGILLSFFLIETLFGCGFEGFGLEGFLFLTLLDVNAMGRRGWACWCLSLSHRYHSPSHCQSNQIQSLIINILKLVSRINEIYIIFFSNNLQWTHLTMGQLRSPLLPLEMPRCFWEVFYQQTHLNLPSQPSPILLFFYDQVA